MNTRTKGNSTPKAKKCVSGMKTFRKARIEIAGIPPERAIHGMACRP